MSDGLLDGLARWAADARADETVRSRARERWLRRQAEEEGTLAGALLDLAERGAPVQVATTTGRRHRGVVTAVGHDFCGLRDATGRDVLVALAALAWVRPLPGDAEAPAGDRPLALDVALGEALTVLAAGRPRVQVVPGSDADTLAGELWAVGRDVVTVRLDGEPRALVFAALRTITEVATADAR